MDGAAFITHRGEGRRRQTPSNETICHVCATHAPAPARPRALHSISNISQHFSLSLHTNTRRPPAPALQGPPSSLGTAPRPCCCCAAVRRHPLSPAPHLNLAGEGCGAGPAAAAGCSFRGGVQRLRDTAAGARALEAPAMVGARQAAVRLHAALCGGGGDNREAWDQVAYAGISVSAHAAHVRNPAGQPRPAEGAKARSSVLTPKSRAPSAHPSPRPRPPPSSLAPRPAPDSGAMRCGHWSLNTRQPQAPSRHTTSGTPSSVTGVGRSARRYDSGISGHQCLRVGEAAGGGCTFMISEGSGGGGTRVSSHIQVGGQEKHVSMRTGIPVCCTRAVAIRLVCGGEPVLSSGITGSK